MYLYRDLSKIQYLAITERFLIRDLTVSDASENYLQWLKDEASVEFIEGKNPNYKIEDLREYIKTKTLLNNVRFFGIFDKNTNLHIGNIKFEPIDLVNLSAFMGILIGDKSWRGKGVFAEVFSETVKYLSESYGLKKIYLSVNSEHSAAIKAYQKSGFIITENYILADTRSGFVMTYEII